MDCSTEPLRATPRFRFATKLFHRISGRCRFVEQGILSCSSVTRTLCSPHPQDQPIPSPSRPLAMICEPVYVDEDDILQQKIIRRAQGKSSSFDVTSRLHSKPLNERYGLVSPFDLWIDSDVSMACHHRILSGSEAIFPAGLSSRGGTCEIFRHGDLHHSGTLRPIRKSERPRWREHNPTPRTQRPIRGWSSYILLD